MVDYRDVNKGLKRQQLDYAKYQIGVFFSILFGCVAGFFGAVEFGSTAGIIIGLCVGLAGSVKFAREYFEVGKNE